jgi:hypothetical protein
MPVERDRENRSLRNGPDAAMLGRSPSPRPIANKEPAGGVEPPIELTAESLWSEVSSRLRGALNETTYRTWFDHVDGVHLTDDDFVLAVPNDFARDWIEGHFLGLIRAAVSDATGQERRVQLQIAESAEEPATPAEQPRREALVGGLNPKYTLTRS